MPCCFDRLRTSGIFCEQVIKNTQEVPFLRLHVALEAPGNEIVMLQQNQLPCLLCGDDPTDSQQQCFVAGNVGTKSYDVFGEGFAFFQQRFLSLRGLGRALGAANWRPRRRAPTSG